MSFISLITLFVLLFTISTDVLGEHPITTGEDKWIQVRSKNFFLIGNAKEKDMRRVATKLEQFRQTFRSLFPKARFNQTIETNVVVFKNKKSYKPFLPKRSDGKADTGIAGYFQSGEDVNYITLSTEGKDEDTYGTIFHEYIHFLLNTNFGRSEIPPWFNEGLAEYYQTFKIKNDQDVYLGKLQNNHLALLQRNKLIPLKTFFAMDNYSLHRNGNHSRSIFYAQAWVLIHYLIQTKQSVNMSKFLVAVMNNVDQEKAFLESFNLDYETMEKALKKYAKQRVFKITVARFQNKLLFDDLIKVTPLSEAEANAYLGDLLYHTHEYDDAEPYLQKALSLDANQSLANTALGLVRMRQRKFDEAKKYLEKAVATNRKNHYAHYNYAYVLSRESQDEFGYVSRFPKDKAEKMRKSLAEAIKINPNFSESYKLLAFISFVNNENLDVAISYLQKGLKLQPGNQEYRLLLAQIYVRQEKLNDAEKIADKVLKTAIEPNLRSNANQILETISRLKENQARREKREQEMEKQGIKMPEYKKLSSLTEKELEKIKQENTINDLNRQIEKPLSDEKQVVGFTKSVECLGDRVKYTIQTDDGELILMSKDFNGLNLVSFSEESEQILLGCGAKLEAFKTVYIYRIEENKKMKSNGNLTSMVFVPKYFRLKTSEELANAREIVIVKEQKPTELSKGAIDNLKKQRSLQMLAQIKSRLRNPLKNEIRKVGILEEIRCNRKYSVFYVKIDGQTLKLRNISPKDFKIVTYTPDGSGIRFGCGTKPAPIKAVITYRPSKKRSKKYQGDIVALEFVPSSFELE